MRHLETNTKQDYWNQYYRGETAKPFIPSQFAAFVLGEVPEGNMLVDVGCGNGRDSIFFAQHGHPVIGLDGSAEAISTCKRYADSLGLNTLEFLELSFGEASHYESLIEKIITGGNNLFIYSRFFLHAITESQEASFLSFANSACGKTGRVALEFRTHRDKDQKKVTPQHYRRYIEPLAFMARAREAGFTVEYFVEGFGFAKYRGDDAHVARMVLKKT